MLGSSPGIATSGCKIPERTHSRLLQINQARALKVQNHAFACARNSASFPLFPIAFFPSLATNQFTIKEPHFLLKDMRDTRMVKMAWPVSLQNLQPNQKCKLVAQVWTKGASGNGSAWTDECSSKRIPTQVASHIDSCGQAVITHSLDDDDGNDGDPMLHLWPSTL